MSLCQLYKCLIALFFVGGGLCHRPVTCPRDTRVMPRMSLVHGIARAPPRDVAKYVIVGDSGDGRIGVSVLICLWCCYCCFTVVVLLLSLLELITVAVVVWCHFCLSCCFVHCCGCWCHFCLSCCCRCCQVVFRIVFGKLLWMWLSLLRSVTLLLPSLLPSLLL